MGGHARLLSLGNLTLRLRPSRGQESLLKVVQAVPQLAREGRWRLSALEQAVVANYTRPPVASPDCKRRLVTAFQVRVLNPPIRALAARGLAPGVALLQTTGRKSGQPRRTPVSNGLDRATNTFWIVAEMGRKAAYVRNIEADPRVWIGVRGRWRSGTAHVLEGDDARARLRSISRVNALGVRALGTELVVVRVDLDP
jgi:deazaflavin-dependent oxidoreductase (nitroreductase family)